uniref:Uncharacterized protein n=1 Tax=Rhizophora mucronata TaxID=61149 RepID=A0A2P2PGW4_RHIMU
MLDDGILITFGVPMLILLGTLSGFNYVTNTLREICNQQQRKINKNKT